MTRGFVTNIDLAGMEPPDVIETLDFETIIAALKDDMQTRMEDLGLDFDVKDLESDPAIKILEVAADREIIVRARVNGAAKALLLALSKVHDLEHLGYWFGVERETVTEATETAEAVMETDERLRKRVQLAPQAFSTAGPIGAYMFQTLTVAPTVKDVGVISPRPGVVAVYPLVDTGDGTPSQAVLNTIRNWLQSEAVRPLTDEVTVARPLVVHQEIDVTLVVRQGPDPAVLISRAKTALEAYGVARHRVGYELRLSGIYQAALVTGVDDVIINAPKADVDPGTHGAVYVTGVTVNHKILA